MNDRKHYNLTVSEDNGKSLTTTNVSTAHPDEIVRLMTLAGLAAAKDASAEAPKSDCGCGGTCGCHDSVEVVSEVDPTTSEYSATPKADLDLDDYSKKTADGIPRQPKRIQPSRGDNPLSYDLDEGAIFESLMNEFEDFEHDSQLESAESNPLKDHIRSQLKRSMSGN